MPTVVNISKDASLVVDFTSAWIAANGSLQNVENDGRFLLDEVDGASSDRGGSVAAIWAGLKRQNPATLAK